MFFLSVLVPVAAAQWTDHGRLNTWALSRVSRAANYEDLIYLKAVRVSKNKGFDRIVFEFTGGLPRYQIEYVRSGSFETTGETFVNVGGKAFLDVNLQTLPYPEKGDDDTKIPAGNLKLPVFREIKEIEWFEGVRNFGIGLNAKKMFRVQELTDPYRLVIDFKQ